MVVSVTAAIRLAVKIVMIFFFLINGMFYGCIFGFDCFSRVSNIG